MSTMATMDQICTSIAPIPLPADDCDRDHSMHAALSSLSAATASFDAVMDSMLTTTTRHRQRVVDLEQRMAKFRQLLHRLDSVAASKMKESELDDRVCMLFCPASYETALKGMGSELTKVKGELDSNDKPHDKLLEMSTVNLARSAADAAVQKCLLADVQKDNGQAVPSDAWLDHASIGLGVGKALERTNEQRSVPVLMGEDIRKGEMDYQRILDALVLNASTAAANTHDGVVDRLESMEGSPGGFGRGGGGDDESVYSVTSQMSAVSVASSTRMTAGQRRRWHKQQQMQSIKASTRISSTQMHPVLSTHPEVSSQTSPVAGRQQAAVGSQPYLCEALHDSYGIGVKPPIGLVDCSGYSAARGGGGTEFYPPPGNVTDLLVFNTTRNSYGSSKTAALLPSAMHAGTRKSAAKETGDEKASPTSPTSRKKPNGSVTKPTSTMQLSHLVFKVDKNAEAKDTPPALDLPASLPAI